MAEAALALGLAHRKFDYYAMNMTPYGSVIAAPRPHTHELDCRDGLKYYARIPDRNIRAALDEVERQQAVLCAGRAREPATGKYSGRGLDLATRMAVQSAGSCCGNRRGWRPGCAGAAAGRRRHPRVAGTGPRFPRYWPLRNKGTTAKCAAFLRWRMTDYRAGA